jgi:hypothetical protein
MRQKAPSSCRTTVNLVKTSGIPSLTGSAQWESLEEAIRAKEIALLRERLGDDLEGQYELDRAMPPDEIVKLALTSY